MSDMAGSDGPDEFRIGTLGRHTLVYGLGTIVSKAVAVVMMPIYTRLLTPSDYGVLQLIQMTFEVVTIVAGSRIALGIFHYYHKEEDEGGRRTVISTAFILLASTYGMASVGTILAAPSVAEFVFGQGEPYTTFVRVAALSMAFEGLIIVPFALLQLREASKLFVQVSLGRLGLQVVLNLIFLIPLGMGVLGVLLSSVLTHAVVGVLLGLYLIRTIGVRFDPGAVRDFLRFGAPLVVMQVATFFVTFGDRYFLNRAATTADVGLYGLAYQFGFLVSMIGYGPFETGWGPQRFAVAKRSDRDDIYAKVFIYLNVLLFSVGLGVALFGGDAVRLITAPEFHEAAAFIPVLALAMIFNCWSSHLNIGTYVTERTEYYTMAKWGAAFVALAGYLWLIPRWLAWGATVTTLASLAADALLSYGFSQRLWWVGYRWGPVVRLAALAILVGAVSVLTPELSLRWSILYHVALFSSYGLLVWWLPILTPEEKAGIRRLVGRLLGDRVTG